MTIELGLVRMNKAETDFKAANKILKTTLKAEDLEKLKYQ
jgi:hypothetical protein